MKTIMRKKPKGFLVLVWLLLWFVAPQNGFAAATFDEIVVFGDSLSDNGNLVFVENQPKPDPQIYYEGRFSNGPVWVEYLADPQRLNAPLTDRAIAGAQSGGFVGLNVQIPAYVATADSPSPSTLFIIWIGGNDFLNGDGDAQAVVANINEAMEELVEFGAKHILVLNLPDLGAIPAELGKPEAAEATAFSTEFNTALATMLNNFRVEHPDIGVYEFDVFAFASAVKSDPAAYGFTNATEPSPNFDIPDNFDGAGYVFWDERHPTTSMHSLIADEVLAALNAQVAPSDQAPDTGNNTNGDNGGSSCFIKASTW